MKDILISLNDDVYEALIKRAEENMRSTRKEIAFILEAQVKSAKSRTSK